VADLGTRRRWIRNTLTNVIIDGIIADHWLLLFQIPLNTWIVPLEDLEAAAGLQVFGSYLTLTRYINLLPEYFNPL
jgi:hypothetical protein